MKIIDLSVTIEDHFRWKVDRYLKADYHQGDLSQVTWMGWGVHGFTHIDAPKHMFPDGHTTDDITLDRVVGRAALLDLSDIGPSQEIPLSALERYDDCMVPGDIALLRTNWDQRRSIKDPTFWTESPYMGQEATEYLLSKKVKAVGFDFPQDYPIRNLLENRIDPLEEYITHHILLRNGILLIEYLCNLGSLTASHATLFALPLKIPNSDGAPARVIAIENFEP